ncbi:MAG TPA: hypothetical protein VGM92_10370 [Candidatus Kapabacteria bacterium]|jgi:hypothetical protein
MNKVRSKRTPTPRIARQAPRKTERQQKEISDAELLRLAKASRAHEWLRDPAEDIYTLNDGKPASWPKPTTEGASR